MKDKSKELRMPDEKIKDNIHTIRGLQVMLDKDLASLYGVSTRVLNQAVKRNIERFPEHFMFRLTEYEYACLKFQDSTSDQENRLGSQDATSNKDKNLKSQSVTSRSDWGGRRALPFVFTEQGVSMLSGVLKSKTAIRVSIQVMDAFVAMRRFISKNAEIFRRLDNVERKHIEYDEKFEKIFDAIENKGFVKKQGIFYNGQVFDAHKFISDIVMSAKKSIILIDNYIDDSVLTLFSKKDKTVRVTIFTKHISRQLRLDLEKHNSQYDPIKIKGFKDSHDRFIIIDDRTVYHIGASLKDLGKKWFAFSRFDRNALDILRRLG
jgi:hypothetical protein